MKKILFCTLSIFLFMLNTMAQEDSTKVKNAKKGFSFSGVPALAYDSDLGFRYGLVANIYYYGDGSRYPDYNHSLYLEWSKTTKGSMISNLTYDSETLIPNTRLTFEASYLTEQTLDFLGFNGYQSNYNAEFTNTDSPDYISRVFYKHDLKRLRIKADFQGNIMGEKLRWLGGFAHYGNKIATVDIAKLNKGQKADRVLPNVPTLYDRYAEWGILNKDQLSGSNVQLIKAGLVWDTRDNEPNPNRGMWSEALLLTAPGFLGNKFGYSMVMLTHRQYFTLLPNWLTFAYRLRYQTTISGEIPFYMLPYVFDSKQTQFGLGGAKTLRGILRNRVVGKGVAFTNLELRSKLLKTILFKQNFYIALSAFTDAGIVTQPYNIDTSNVPAEYQNMFNTKQDKLHISYGLGVHFALNENFVVAVDYGMAANKQDGSTGLYIGLNFIF